MTRVGRWLNTTGSFVYSYPRFDTLGNVIAAKDGNGHVTTFSFADDFGQGQNPGTPSQNPATPTYAFPTLITSPPPSSGAPVHTSRSQYDYWTGLLTGFRDRNNIVSQTIYNDPFNRPTQVKSALGVSGVESHTSTYYAPATVFGITLAKNDVLTATDLNTLDDASVRLWTVTDGYGRTTEAWKRDPQSDVKAITVYDALGRVKQTSNPFRPLSESAVFTTTTYDFAARVTAVTTPDNAVLSTSYSGNSVTVTDQAGKKRKSVTDALGRLSEVYEDPEVPGDPLELNYQTTYVYDVLDNLVKVTQGTQQRFFMYDSLRRLIRSRNPEQSTYEGLALSDPVTGNSAWSIGYQYDANDNLTHKTDARGVISTYAYDTFNRNTTIDYSDTSSINPDVKWFYDGATNGKGRFWYFYKGGDFSNGSNVEHTSIDSYDALGRPLVQRQLFKLNGAWSPTYQTSRSSYNLAGSVRAQTYPSGHTIAYTYDSAGRTSSFTGQLGDGVNRTYSNSILYSPFGGLTREHFGTDTTLYHKLLYNIRGQLFDTRLSSVNDLWDWNRGRLILYYSSNHLWGQSGTDNNGNVRFAETWIPPEDAVLDQAQSLNEQSYSYDALNRLSSVTEQRIDVAGGWVWQPQFHQAYGYDRFGNRTINALQTSGMGINNEQFDVETTTNRLKGPSGQFGVMTYDSAGNLITDTYTGAGAREYDAENRMTQAWGGTNQWQYYTYNADGHRTRRKVNNQETWQIYGMDGELLAEYPANGAVASPQKEYGYRNGQLLITASSSQRQWLIADHLGTPRMVIDQTGSLANMKRHDYLPFGEELGAGVGGRTPGEGYTGGDGVRQQFTSKERDVETGLDYFLARYYSAVQGRFTSPDEFSGGPDDLFDFTENASQNPTFYADLSNPQSLNKYQYVYNDPLNMVDPDGHCPVICPPVAGLGDSLELITNPSRALDKLQAKISIAGLAPGAGELADGFNAAISLVRGNYKEALLDAAAAAGPVGSAAALGNRIRKIAGKAVEVTIDGSKHPESARHALEAQKAGQPDTLTVDRSGAQTRRREAMSGTKPTKGKDRDEYPPAVMKEGGKGASVRPISPSDNRGAGSSVGNQTKGLTDGTKIKFKVKNLDIF